MIYRAFGPENAENGEKSPFSVSFSDQDRENEEYSPWNRVKIVKIDPFPDPIFRVAHFLSHGASAALSRDLPKMTLFASENGSKIVIFGHFLTFLARVHRKTRALRALLARNHRN